MAKPKSNAPAISEEHYKALSMAADYFGKSWKSKLSVCWMNASYPSELSDVSHLLQQVRNLVGPSGLAKIKLKENQQ